MIVESDLSPKIYRAAVKRNLENFRCFWDERFSGRMLGSVFYITHHSYTEWNRRITGELNTAIGYLKRTETGCEAHFIITTGLLHPLYLPLTFLFCILAFMIGLVGEGVDGDFGFHIIFIISAIITALTTVSTAICHALTRNGIQGGDKLLHFLQDPTFGQGE